MESIMIILGWMTLGGVISGSATLLLTLIIWGFLFLLTLLVGVFMTSLFAPDVWSFFKTKVKKLLKK